MAISKWLKVWMLSVGNGIDKAPAEPRWQGGHVHWGGPTETQNTTIF